MPNPPGVVLFVFVGDVTGRDPETALAASEEGIPAWVDRANLDGMPLVEDLPALLPRVLDKDPDDPPVYAHYAFTDAGLQITFDHTL
jgi:hypothetical protein